MHETLSFWAQRRIYKLLCWLLNQVKLIHAIENRAFAALRMTEIAQDGRNCSGWQNLLRMAEIAQDGRNRSGWQKSLRMTEIAQDDKICSGWQKKTSSEIHSLPRPELTLFDAAHRGAASGAPTTSCRLTHSFLFFSSPKRSTYNKNPGEGTPGYNCTIIWKSAQPTNLLTC